MSDNLHFEEEVTSFETIKELIRKEELSEKECKLLGDYLTRKKSVEDKWSSQDEKKFYRAKRLLSKQEKVVSLIKEKKKVVE